MSNGVYYCMPGEKGGIGVTPRERTERWERANLAPWAAHSDESKGRAGPEPPCDVRTCYQRDVDRITHSKAFRRLAHKTQVFLNPEGDHYRTRLTHVLEVSRIARTAARALSLNEDLVEAAAMGHDLGHAPFGHAGERALNELIPFSHNVQGRRVAELLEKGGRGLNLSYETLDAIERHSGSVEPQTLEGRLVHIADRVAYLNHDMDDAIRAGILTEEDLLSELRDILGNSTRERINTMVIDLVSHSGGKAEVSLSPEIAKALSGLRQFMFDNVYFNPAAKAEERKVGDMVKTLFDHFVRHPDELPDDLRALAETQGVERSAADYIAGMTDRFAEEKAMDILIPRGWEKR